MDRAYYSDTISAFLAAHPDAILGQLVKGASIEGASIATAQTDAWIEQIAIMKATVQSIAGDGAVYFEYSIPRLGKRIDVLAIISLVIFVLEFKVGEVDFKSAALDQVCDYALDLKNFHETSHTLPIAPIVISTRAKSTPTMVAYSAHGDSVMRPMVATPESLPEVISRALQLAGTLSIDPSMWELGRYRPTPTIVEAAMALYGGHKVEEISKKDAGATNLAITSKTVDEVIKAAKTN